MAVEEPTDEPTEEPMELFVNDNIGVAIDASSQSVREDVDHSQGSTQQYDCEDDQIKPTFRVSAKHLICPRRKRCRFRLPAN